MKTIPSALNTHLQGDVTSMCTCWKITRTDGVVFGFTDHDQDLYFGSLNYVAEVGYTRTAVSTDDKFGVDNMEVMGILNSDYIDEHDLRNGVYNYARIDILAVNWRSLTDGVITLRRGWFGEVTVTPNGYFTTEIRGLTQALSNNFGENISAMCRADLGDSRCTVPIDPPTWTPNTFYAAGSYIKVNFGDALPADPYRGEIWQTTADLTSASSQPAFTSSPTSDNGGSWTVYNSFTKQGSIVSVNSRKSFLVQGLTVPASALLGPLVDAMNVTFLINGGSIAGGGFPYGVGSNVVTMTLVDPNGNDITVNTGVTGGGGLFNVVTGNGTSSVQLVGTFENMLAVLSLGTNWTNNATLTSIINISASDTIGHSISYTIAVPQNDDLYANATIYFVSGQNAGKAMEVQGFSSSTITLWLSMPFLPVSGDVFRIYPQCDHTRATCRRYGNIINMRAEPDLPGQDFLYSPNLSF